MPWQDTIEAKVMCMTGYNLLYNTNVSILHVIIFEDHLISVVVAMVT